MSGWRTRLRWVVVHPRDRGPGPVWPADPEEVLPALRELLGVEAVLLRCLDEHEDEAARRQRATVLAVPREPPAPPDRMAWAGRPSWPARAARHRAARQVQCGRSPACSGRRPPPATCTSRPAPTRRCSSTRASSSGRWPGCSGTACRRRWSSTPGVAGRDRRRDLAVGGGDGRPGGCRARLRAACDELAAHAVALDRPWRPAPGQRGQGPGGHLFFDWTDACVAHPFLDLPTIRRGTAFTEDDEVEAELRGRVRAAYLPEWAAFEPPRRLARAWELAAPLGALHQAIGYRTLTERLQPPTDAHMAQSTAWWLRRVLADLRRPAGVTDGTPAACSTAQPGRPPPPQTGRGCTCERRGRWNWKPLRPRCPS